MNNDMQINNLMNQPGTGLFNFNNFGEVVAAAEMLAKSNIVPEIYRSIVEKTKWNGYEKASTVTENPNAVANCLLALNMSNRMGADPLMIMQNLHVIEGRPAWSSQFIIAGINTCGRFTTLQFEFKDLGSKVVEYQEISWVNKQKKINNKQMTVNEFSCVAWATDRASGARVESTPITLEMAIKEGWYLKNGSKWQTMPQQMAMYRAAAFFGRAYAPEVTMGIYTRDEIEDFTPERDVTPKPQNVAPKQTLSQSTQAPAIEYVNDEQADILSKMIESITLPKSVENINKVIPDVRRVPASHFDVYRKKLIKTIDAQIIQQEKESYAQDQSKKQVDPNDYIESVVDDGRERFDQETKDELEGVVYENISGYK